MDASMRRRIQNLGDLDIALMVSMVAEEHCILSADSGDVADLVREVRATCKDTFGLQPVVIECNPKTTVDDFNEAMLVEIDEDPDYDPDRRPSGFDSIRRSSAKVNSTGRFGSIAGLDDRRIADVVVVASLDTASNHVQVQAYELLRSKRIFTRHSMHVAPKNLLFITILSTPEARLFRHLNDIFCISHFHSHDYGFPHLEEGLDKRAMEIVLPSDIKTLRELRDQVILTAEMAQYVHNIVVFMRNSRYVKGGATATATRQLRLLSRTLAPLHGMDYVPPSLVALAARKVYPHRLVLATAENERSLLWGSDPEAIRELLDGLTIEDVIEEVLSSIETPL